jgi:hypothetical protein
MSRRGTSYDNLDYRPACSAVGSLVGGLIDLVEIRAGDT